MGDPVDDIIRVAALTMSEDQADRLVGWIALRTGRSKALARGRRHPGPPAARGRELAGR